MVRVLLVVGAAAALFVVFVLWLQSSRSTDQSLQVTARPTPSRTPQSRYHTPTALDGSPHQPFPIECLRAGLAIEAELLFRQGGPGTHEWHEVTIRELWGEKSSRTGWSFVREVNFTSGPDARSAGSVAVDRLIVLRDPKAFTDYRSIPDITRWLRLRAGGINPQDFALLSEFQAERATEIEMRAETARQAEERQLQRQAEAEAKAARKAARLAEKAERDAAKAALPKRPRGRPRKIVPEE